MSPQVERLVLWFMGPMLAVALGAFAVVGRGGPGFFFLSLTAGAALLLGAPILQFALLCTTKYKGRHRAACGAALLIVFVGVAIPTFFGVFNFY